MICLRKSFSPDAVASTATLAYTDLQGGRTGVLDNGKRTVNWLEGNINVDTLHVEDQAVNRVTFRRYAKGVDTILITDQKNQPVTGVSVTAACSGPSQEELKGSAPGHRAFVPF